MRAGNYFRQIYQPLEDRARDAYYSVVEQLNALHNYTSRLMQMYSERQELMLIGTDGKMYGAEVYRMPDVFLSRGRGKNTFQRTDKPIKGRGKGRSNRPKR